MQRNFEEWVNNFKRSIAGYDYYVDFVKVVKNVEKYKVELNILNSLIGSKSVESDFGNLIVRYPELLKCIPLLLAVRSSEIYVQDLNKEFIYDFSKMNYSIEHYTLFMKKSGLFDMLSNHIVNNLVDYALGVETGLDSNGRKNRGGHLMENLVESYLQKSGFVKGNDYFKEMYLSEVENRWNINLSALSNHGKTKKRFDFVVKTSNMIYAIETNFYSGVGGGSKLNETARSYKLLAQESFLIQGFTFVWITDGQAWKSALGNLRETFEVLETMYNIEDLKRGVIHDLFV